MADDIQELKVESVAVAKILNAKYVPPTKTVPVDFAAAGTRNPVIWLEKPNVEVTGAARLYRAASGGPQG